MPRVFPADFFSPQFFPDVLLSKVTVTPERLILTVTDSDWALQPKISLFYGPGDMIFFYSGEIKYFWRNVKESIWHSLAQEPTLDDKVNLEIITHIGEKWAFRFRLADRKKLIELRVPTVNKIIWTGEGDAYDPEFDDDI